MHIVVMHLIYSIFTCCWILLVLFIMSYEMGKVFALLKFSITSVFFGPSFTESKKLTFAGFTFSFWFVLLSPISKRYRIVCTSVNLYIIVVHPESFQHNTFNAQSSKLLQQQVPYLLYGLRHQLYFSVVVIEQLLLCFSVCAIVSFSRGLNKDSLCASTVTYL